MYLHAADRATPFFETLQAVDKLHKEGKFVSLGLSNFTSFEVAEISMICKTNGFVRPSVYQAMYNVLTRGIEAELVPACRRYGLDIVIYNPLAGGLFSGKIKTTAMVPNNGGRFSDSNPTGVQYRNRYFRNSTFEAMKLCEGVVEREGLGMVELALRWVVHHSALRMGGEGRDGVLIGVSSVEQLEENLGYLERGPLSKEVVKVLERAWEVSKGDVAAYWHGEVEYAEGAAF